MSGMRAARSDGPGRGRSAEAGPTPAGPGEQGRSFQINVSGGIETFREDLDAFLGKDSARQLIAHTMARSAEHLAHTLADAGEVPAGEEGVAALLHILAGKGYGRSTIAEHDWEAGWLLVKVAGAFEAQTHLQRAGPADEPLCDFLRGVLAGAYGYLRKRGGVPAEDVLAVELACAGQGHPVCRFAVGPRETLASHEVFPPAARLTSRQELEEALRRSREGESGLRGFIEDMPFGLAELDADGRITFANRKTLDIVRLPLTKLQGSHFIEFIHEEDREATMAAFQEVVEGRADPYPRQCRLLGAEGEASPCAVDAFPVRDADGRVVGYQAVVIDLADRVHMAGHLQRFHEGLRESPMPFLELDPEGRVRSANGPALELLGTTEEETLGVPFDRFVAGTTAGERSPRGEAYRTFLDVAAGRAKSAVVRWEVARPDGERREARFRLVADGLKIGKVERVLVLAEDAGGGGPAAAEDHRALLEAAPVGIGLADAPGAIFAANRRMQEITGYTLEELKSVNLGEMYADPADRARLLELVSRSGRAHDFETRLKRKDGTVYDASLSVETVRLDGREVLLTVAHDITERKRAEKALVASEARWRSLAENAADIIIVVDRDGSIQYINRTVSGFSVEETIGTKAFDYVRPEYHAAVRETVAAAFRTGRSGSFEIVGDGPDGRDAWYAVGVGPIRQDGEVVAATLIVADITDRKKVEEELRKSEVWFRSLIENGASVYAVVDAQGKVLYESPSLERVYGWTPEELVGRSVFEHVHPEDMEYATGRLRDVHEEPGVMQTAELRYRHRNGSWRTIEVSGVNLLADPAVGGVVLTSHDITDRKLAEEALRESEERASAVFDNAVDGISLADPETKRFRFSNQKFCDMLGYGPEEIMDLGVRDIHPEEDLPHVLDQFEKQRKRELVLAKDIPVKRRDGSVFFADINAAPVAFGGNTYLMGIFRDVTDRRRAEEALRDSEELHRTLMEALPDAVTMSDLEGNITYASQQSVEMHAAGSADDLLGTSSFDLIAPEDRERAAANLRKTQKTGSVKDVEYALLRSDGSRFPAELSAAVVPDAQGKPKAFVAIVRDITERRRAEEALREVEGKRTELALEVQTLRTEMQGRYGPESIIGQDRKMRAIYDTILAVSRTNATVLIQGETGTGKELVAKAVHYNSSRREKPFIKVDCGALAENLLESELFGHVKGAFTGAVRERPGRFELAADGTIFLDEIHNLSMPLQAKLLRVVQEGRFEKVGGTKTIEVDVRIVAATNEDLEALVDAGEFRKDLYYRVNVIPIRLPPLRERRGDIPLLVSSFVGRFTERHGKEVSGVSNQALGKLAEYDWPGNVRELENIVEQAVVFCGGDAIQEDDIRLTEPGRQRARREARVAALVASARSLRGGGAIEDARGKLAEALGLAPDDDEAKALLAEMEGEPGQGGREREQAESYGRWMDEALRLRLSWRLLEAAQAYEEAAKCAPPDSTVAKQAAAQCRHEHFKAQAAEAESSGDMQKAAEFYALDEALQKQMSGSGLTPVAQPRPLKEALEASERRLLLDALARAEGNKKKAADSLGISRSALYEKLKRHKI